MYEFNQHKLIIDRSLISFFFIPDCILIHSTPFNQDQANSSSFGLPSAAATIPIEPRASPRDLLLPSYAKQYPGRPIEDIEGNVSFHPAPTLITTAAHLSTTNSETLSGIEHTSSGLHIPQLYSHWSSGESVSGTPLPAGSCPTRLDVELTAAILVSTNGSSNR